MKQINDATPSAKGTIYQLYVALEKCFQLREGEMVFIERYGDVTLGGREQIETKRYSDTLTDGHINFWKTLKNWTNPAFKETEYKWLILCTTQPLGANSSFGNWDTLSVDERIKILVSIQSETKAREQERLARPKNKEKAVSELFKIQETALDPKNREKLKRVIERFVIAAASPDINGVFQRLVEIHGRTFPKTRVSDFMEALLGFVISPKIIDTPSWEITQEAFDNKVRELAPLYVQGTRIFPTKYKRTSPPSPDEIAALSAVFIGKIEEIQYHKMIPIAAMEYIYASDTVIHDLRDYNVPPGHFPQFKDDVKNQFEPLHRRSSRSIKEVIRDSQDFYDTVTASSSPPFPGFENPNLAFRNGVIHMICDDPLSDIRWKLTDE